MTASTIVDRIVANRAKYAERNAKKQAKEMKVYWCGEEKSKSLSERKIQNCFAHKFPTFLPRHEAFERRRKEEGVNALHND